MSPKDSSWGPGRDAATEPHYLYPPVEQAEDLRGVLRRHGCVVLDPLHPRIARRYQLHSRGLRTLDHCTCLGNDHPSPSIPGWMADQPGHVPRCTVLLKRNLPSRAKLPGAHVPGADELIA